MKNWEKEVLPNVDCKYGAPTGRRNMWPSDRNAVVKLHLNKMRLIDGGYDVGSAYWGGPSDMWVAWQLDVPADEPEDIFRITVRAPSREVAKQKIRLDLPNARFVR